MDKTIDYPNDGNGKGGKIVTPWTKPLDIRANISWSVFFFSFSFSIFYFLAQVENSITRKIPNTTTSGEPGAFMWSAIGYEGPACWLGGPLATNNDGVVVGLNIHPETSMGHYILPFVGSWRGATHAKTSCSFERQWGGSMHKNLFVGGLLTTPSSIIFGVIDSGGNVNDGNLIKGRHFYISENLWRLFITRFKHWMLRGGQDWHIVVLFCKLEHGDWCHKTWQKCLTWYKCFIVIRQFWKGDLENSSAADQLTWPQQKSKAVKPSRTSLIT